ncbi:MAG: GDSL family lipase, partial [Rudanella sp.]|nr:GDSL family lipase [Rudanella sp.]
KIDSLGAKAILVSPIPSLTADSADNPTNRNAMLERYSAVMAKMASARGKRFVDVFKPIQAMSKMVKLTENGIHLNETGYYSLAIILEKALELPPRNQSVTTSVTPNTPFTINERYLPLALPSDKTGLTDMGQILRITGLKKGFYTLAANGSDIKTASAKEWEAGIAIRQGPLFEQVRALRQLIVKKNELFFFQYRPPNTTYILGFRSYEQGRHAKGLDEQSILIKWLEGQIALHRTPTPIVYQLNLLK